MHTIAKTLNPRYAEMKTAQERKKERSKWARRIARTKKLPSHTKRRNI
jgi:hypothetical protein